MGAPEIVEKLAASVNGIPLRFYEYDDHWVILMVDGRKVRFAKTDPIQPRSHETVQDDREGVEIPENHRKRSSHKDK